jgi:glucosylceramidase
VTVNSQTKAVTYSGQFWALAHYSSFVQRGARRVESTSAITNLFHTAFENTDGRRVLVIANPAESRKCQIQLGEMAADVSLERDSLTTLQWS